MDRSALSELGRVAHGGSTDPDVIDFSANVNPSVPDGVKAVYRSALEQSRRYPPEPPRSFLEVAAADVGCEPKNVVPTAGGMAAIRLAVAVTVAPGDEVLLPAPSFGEYEREVRLQGGEPTFVDADHITEIDPAPYRLAVVCTPNNPTGTDYEETDLRTFAERCRETDTVLLLDEAFLPYTDRASLAGTPGTVVARSLTKIYGLPGLRAGFAVATGQLGAYLQTARRPWSLGTPAWAVGEYCLRQDAFVERTRERTRTERARMRNALESEYDVAPSKAPFLLLEPTDGSVADLLERTRASGLAIRDARTFRGLDRHVRVAVRLPGENDRLLEVLSDV